MAPPARASSGFLAIGIALGLGLWLRLGHADGPPLPPAVPFRAALPVYGSVADFALAERGGRTAARADLLGKAWIADFVFTRCGGPCPQLTARMARLQREIAGPDVRFVTFTVDPDFDTPPVLTEYAKRYGADPVRWLFLTGAKRDVQRLMDGSFHVGAVEGPPELGGITHDTHFVLVDGRGRIRGYYSGEDEDAVARLKRDVQAALDEDRTGH